MSLHDVSKHDDTRLDPKANASDTRAQRDATNTTSIHPVTDATTTKGFLKTGSGQVLGNDGSNNIGLFGFDSTGTMVVKVAKAGYDADTAANANLIFNSSQNVFKIVQTGNATIPSSTAISPSSSAPLTLSVVIAHNLGYVPVVMAYANLATLFYVSGSFQAINSYTPLPIIESAGSLFYGPPTSVSTGSAIITEFYVWYGVDSTNIYFQTNFRVGAGTGTVTSGTIPVKYYLLQETAS